MQVLHEVVNSHEYKLVETWYEDKFAERSGVPYINHIHEGLAIMEQINASLDAMKGYCLHPLFQNDDDLFTVGMSVSSHEQISRRALVLVMEYRYRANAWLSDKVTKDSLGNFIIFGQPSYGLHRDVKDMLIADKVQNYKDFEHFHFGKHDRSGELAHYFHHWHLALGIDSDDLGELLAGIPRRVKAIESFKAKVFA